MATVADYEQIAGAIIEGQAKIMGPVAYQMAGKVGGLTYAQGGPAKIAGDGASVVDKLVGEYAAVTGPLGARMCFMSAKPIIDKTTGVSIAAFSRF